jgi:hypothetical protein
VSIRQALNLMISLQSRPMTLTRPGDEDFTVDVRVAPSNFSRNTEGPSDTTIPGREFVVSKTALDESGFPIPARGDFLTDPDLGTMTVSDIREMYDIGGAIIAYRLRIS